MPINRSVPAGFHLPSPGRLLALFGWIQFVCWFDIGSIASGGVTGWGGGLGYPPSGLRGSFQVDDLHLGMLSALYRWDSTTSQLV